jgi:mono/diheme cytochrome c family protein
MMSFAAIDPLFLALNAISNKDLEGVVEVGDYCLRCHAPTAWLAGRSEPVDGSEMTEEDREAGVSLPA